MLGWRELAITYDMKRQGEIREMLSQNSIDYKVKVIDRKSPSPMGGGVRARTGSFGEKAELMYEYVFYVRKGEYERARGLTQR